MNKNLIILIIAIALGVGGYFIYSGGQKEGMEHASGMADDAAKATEDAAAKATDAVADTANATADAAKDAAGTVADQASDAVQSATDTAKATADQATDAAQSVADTAKDAANTVADQASDAAQSVADTAKDALENMSPADLLKPENFDMEKVTGLLDASSVPDNVKSGLKSALDAAKDNPDMLKVVLDNIKAALGL